MIARKTPITPEQKNALVATPIRVITATSLFDGHDAAINVMRRIIQREGAEVIHLGHNRSVKEIVDAAIQEDAQAIAVSSYQGGHMEFFKYMVDLLRENDALGVKVFVGGGGTIIPDEITELEAYGVTKIYSPEDGQKMGLVGMIRHLLSAASKGSVVVDPQAELDRLPKGHPQSLARLLTYSEMAEAGLVNEEAAQFLQHKLEALVANQLKEARGNGSKQAADTSGSGAPSTGAPVLGITGTGGAGKSSLTDELVRRFLDDFPQKRVAILSVDPTHRRTGGALLGDRIRMNALDTPQAFMRSVATRQDNLSLSRGMGRAVLLCRAAGYDLIIVETAGIGQSDTEIVDLADFTLYVMTAEFGAASQLEKIGMLDYADFIAINKFDKQGSDDALRAVRKQVRRNREMFDAPEDALPVYGTIASRFQDPLTDQMYAHLISRMNDTLKLGWKSDLTPHALEEAGATVSLPQSRVRYLSEIADAVRGYKSDVESQAMAASRASAMRQALAVLGEPVPDDPEAVLQEPAEPRSDAAQTLATAHDEALACLQPEWREQLSRFDTQQAQLAAQSTTYTVRGKEIQVENHEESLSHTRIPKLLMPRYRDWGDRLRWLMLENLPGSFPFTAGVFPFKRPEEEPTRMFAGEGPPERTNRRFHYISAGMPAKRLSTAFDSVTLYGDDPHPRPDIYGKVGNSGVSICNADDMKRLYSGFDLLHPSTSVSMTINGPAPVILAFFLNAGIDQQVEKYLKAEGKWEAAQKEMAAYFKSRGVEAPQYRGDLPDGHDGLGLGLLGINGERLLPPETHAKLKADTLCQVRGTVQADILKEDQAQNTCIFSTDFALKLMGDIQEFFCANDMGNFYSVSVSGYHMAEAGANPISQVAFTLANGFTYLEYYLSRGLSIDQFARNLSFFFSNGMDPEYAVIGRVARRIWAIALKNRYRAGERAQKLKYHIQTSGRSLHAQEISFNDIRTTLQALYALYDNCNSLHTNAYDEAITTPTTESVRRAIAIQLIINRELGLARNHNPLQGSFIIEELTNLVEEAILDEFDRLTSRGGVLGAMETMYQRGKIQDESLYYEEQKHSGVLPIIGINTFLDSEKAGEMDTAAELSRSSDDEKQVQIEGLEAFKKLNAPERDAALEALKVSARRGGNTFEALMACVRSCSLGEITGALYQIGGQYRRSM